MLLFKYSDKERDVMKKINVFCKVIALATALITVLSISTGCQKAPQNKEEENKNLLDISDYTIVHSENSAESAIKLKDAIKIALDLELDIKLDSAEDAKEILIGITNRKESADALAKLEGKEGDAYTVEITENKIAIVGKTDLSTRRGINYFINNYVVPSAKGKEIDISHGKSIIQDYNPVKNIGLAGKLDMDVVAVSQVIDDSKKANFPAIIELQHQPNAEDNGTLIASMSYFNDPAKSMGCIMKSTDQGKTWKSIYYPTDTFTPFVWAGNMAHIYELPEKIGKFPAGTLIYSSNTVNYGNIDSGGTDKGYSHIGVWASTDCGKTWKEISVVAKAQGLHDGVWEPVMFYDNGYLYCFYSDDSHPRYDQRIVYKRSKNGIQWEKAVPVCAFDNFIDRPGMPVITKMGNGEYFLIYEYVLKGRPSMIFYKTTKDITDWNPSDPGTPIEVKDGKKTYYPAAAPCCVWTPAGGENGTLFATGQYQNGEVPQNSIFISRDYGKTWDIVENPLPYTPYYRDESYTWAGYRPIMVLASDPSVIHYINTTNTPEDKAIIQYAKLKLYD